jgi:O-succinylbenzoate-CoA ligase
VSLNLASVLTHHADRYPERPCLIWNDEVISYGALYERSSRVAAGLHRLGLRQGDIVAVLLYNCPAFIELMFATSWIGAIFMPLNWRLAAAELTYIVNHAGAKALVSEPDLLPRVDRPGLGCATYVLVGRAADGWRPYAALAAASPAVAQAEVQADDVHRLMYTSGTTARPKGVMITFGNLYGKNIAHMVEFGITSADKGLVCGPLYHVEALDLTATTVLYAGGSLEIQRTFEVAAVVDALERHNITNVWLAPAMVNQISNTPGIEQRDLSRVRLIIDGGEKMPLPLARRILQLFPNAWFADAYGLTETVSGDTFLEKRKSVEKIGSVGKPCLHVEVAMWDDDDQPVAAGQLGEIVLRGPKVFKGYWRDPEATAQAFRNGWFHTGDIGYLDPEGYVYIVDRKKDMIISGGENIASLEVERALYEHPAVREAAVVAAPDPRWGEVPVAFVALRAATVDAVALQQFCRERLATFKVPKRIYFVDELPRNPSGKVLKRVLRDRVLSAER